MKTIYELDLNEQIEIDNYEYVRRVPGGWIYKTVDAEVGTSIVFVPFNEDMQKQAEHFKRKES